MAHDLELYLVRHAIAAPRGDAWPDDGKRPLTEEGMTRMRRAARGLASLDDRLDLILSSPLVRARQTADILAGAFTPTPAIATVEALAPGGASAEVIAEIQKHARKRRIALVGHEPGLGELAARLMGARHAVPLKKGAVARIDLDAESPAVLGTLRWLLPPRVLRALGK